MFFALGLLGLVPVVLAFVVGSGTLIVAAIVVALVYWGVLAAANTAIDGILKAALFRFAETGEMPGGFEAADPRAVQS